MAEMLSLDRIATEGTQARVALSHTVIREYAEALKDGVAFPPIDVFFDETTYWLADGFHRVEAAKSAGLVAMAATVHAGGQREALLHALGANETHGHRRTDDDRRHAVALMLADPAWQEWSDREIARQCHVSHMLVNRVRRRLEPPDGQRATEATRKAMRGGTAYTMCTGGIGAVRKRASDTAQPVASAQTASEVPADASPPPAEHVASAEAPSVTVLQRDADASRSALSVSQEPLATPVAPSHEHAEHTASVPVEATQTDDTVLSEPLEPQTAASALPAVLQPPSLMDAWQQADDGERKAFVAAYRAELRMLLAVYDNQPHKRTRTSQQSPRPKKHQQKRQRSSANNHAQKEA
jgi:hypothetical protein